jgi:thiamine-monophosphate kinase
MNEFALIDRFFRRAPRDPAVRVGVGDDGAVLRIDPACELVVSVDMLVEGRHFLPGTDPEGLGHKTLAVNLSDMAAMGARPRFALLAGALPDGDAAFLAAFARGFLALAERFGVELVGGDTTQGPRNFCVTILGDVPYGGALLRSGARAGDDVYVSGELGDAALGLAVLLRRTQLSGDALVAAQRRLERPEPRVALGMALRGVAHAALDVSDGLAGDLRHILAESKVGAVIELPAVPRSPALAAKLAGSERGLALSCLLAGGDDYELCFTAPTAMRARIDGIARELALPLSRIGGIVAGSGLVVRDEQGRTLPELPRAFEHFAS